VGKDTWLVAYQWPLFQPLSYSIIGKLIYSRLFGINLIVINSETIARELLDKRSANYSSRPVIRTNELYALSVFGQSVLYPLTT
jgi:hypothetical protein